MRATASRASTITALRTRDLRSCNSEQWRHGIAHDRDGGIASRRKPNARRKHRVFATPALSTAPPPIGDTLRPSALAVLRLICPLEFRRLANRQLTRHRPFRILTTYLASAPYAELGM